MKQLLTDGRAGENSLVLGQILKSLRKIAADLRSRRNRQLVGQAGCHIGSWMMQGTLQRFAASTTGTDTKPPLGKYHVRLQLPDNADCFAVALQDLERVGEVLRVEIPAQLAGRDTVVGNLELRDEFFLDSVIGAHIGNIVAELAKPRRNAILASHGPAVPPPVKRIRFKITPP